MRLKNIAILLCAFLLSTGFSSPLTDKSLKVKPFTVSVNKVKETLELPHSDLTGIYNGISDMYSDSDYVVSGVIKDIQYFEVNCILLRKINVLVNKSYKGGINENTLISVLENDGYIRLKSVYAAAKKQYEAKHGDKNREKDWLYGATYHSTMKEINADMLIRYTYSDKKDSKIKDKLLLFLTDSSNDTYKNKKIKLFLNGKLSYPKGAYASLGLGMGKFTLVGDSYERNKRYPVSKIVNGKTILTEGQFPKSNYTIIEMEDELKECMN